MTEASHISIAAFVSEEERPAFPQAAAHIARALSQAADIPRTCDCTFSSDFEVLQKGESAIIVTSLLPELEKMEEPWAAAEQRLRKAYAALAERGVPVFICTILRHVGSEMDPDLADALRIRIRRLNLLAAEISRETGAFVIDLDRVMADIGARRLQTDYRLSGSAAAELAGHFIALTLVTNGIDALVPFEVQDAARANLVSAQPAIALADTAREDLKLKKDVMSMGQGRRKQMVSTVAYTDEKNYSRWLVGQVLRGAIGPGDAISRLFAAIRRRGVRESAAMLTSGLSRQIKSKK